MSNPNFPINTTVVWDINVFTVIPVYHDLTAKLNEFIAAGKANNDFEKTQEGNTIIITRSWADLESATTWVDYVKSFSDGKVISATVA